MRGGIAIGTKILKIILYIVQLLIEGISQHVAVERAAKVFGVHADRIRKYL